MLHSQCGPVWLNVKLLPVPSQSVSSVSVTPITSENVKPRPISKRRRPIPIRFNIINSLLHSLLYCRSCQEKKQYGHCLACGYVRPLTLIPCVYPLGSPGIHFRQKRKAVKIRKNLGLGAEERKDVNLGAGSAELTTKDACE